MNYLLRAEAVNLGNFVYDTNKIQPTRGGSFLLLNSMQKLPDVEGLPQGVKLTIITTGASIGLYRFNTDNPQDVADAVLKELNKTTGNHATFVVDYLRETGNFKNDLLQLHAMNRRRQYQQPTIALPKQTSGTNEECAFDGVRPGTKKSGEEKVSDSVAFRIESEEVKELRQTIYKGILKNPELNLDFTNDLHDLAFHNNMGNLNNKIAFIYLDGNKFTKIRTALCDTSDKFTEFSNKVESSRSEFLSALLKKAENDESFKIGNKIRLETLLWGGDELEIIVPAWKGWEVLQDFFIAMKDVSYDTAPLTHAGGVVFCNHKAAIREIRRMAHELAEMTKKAIKDDFVDIDKDCPTATHPKDDAFHFLALESFDTVGGKVKPFAETYFGKTIWQKMRIAQEDMGNLTSAIKIMKTDGFPRNKIFDIVRQVKTLTAEQDKLIAAGSDIADLKKNDHKKIDDSLDKYLDSVGKKDDIKDAIHKFTGEEIERWLVISEIWDYVHVGGEQ